MSLPPGSRLGPYEIIGPIGAGAMGVVYRGRDPRIKRDVAIKVLPTTDPDRIRRFEQEAEAAGRVNHPNLLAVYDVGVQDGTPYIVSELLEGQTLRARMASGRVAVAEAIDLAMQIARGLSAAHAQGIVHRDLKPDNIFVAGGQRVAILDFGLARLSGRDEASMAGSTMAPMTEPGMVLGSAGYMAPEQVQGLAADHRSDIFAFGAVLYELLSGTRAFGKPTAVESMTAILREEPPELANSSAQIPAALSRVVRQCLAKRPDDRFQSAHDLELALQAAAADTVSSHASHALIRQRSRAGWLSAAGVAIGVVAMWALVPGFPYGLRHAVPAIGASATSIRSLVVLPLDNFSADPEQEFFSDGMTEALIADLARVGGLRVISRTSAMTYKAARKPLPQIVRELNVDAVVEGSVARAGDRVRITAQLIDGATERHLWSNTYERDARDVLSLQNEVARAIAGEIQITLTPQEQAQLAGTRVMVPEAHEAYLRGRFELAKATEQGINQSIVFFKRATEKDPNYAEPYAGLADAYTALRSVYAPPHAVMPLAKAAAARALELDPKLAAAHVSMGGVLMFYEFDWAGAERELTEAIALSPNLAEAHSYYAQYLATQRRPEEAQRESLRARTLDPLSLQILNDSGYVQYLGRHYDQTVELNLKALDLDPGYWPALRDVGIGYVKLGRIDEAIASLKKARALSDNPSILEELGGAYAAAGQLAEARKLLAELEQRAGERYVCPYEIATVHAVLGDKKSTMAWLEKGLHERADCMPWALSDVKLDALRGDPAFIDLIRRMGIPAAAVR